MEGTISKVYITWGQVNKLLDKIHKQIGSNINYVAGIPRGGTILAILYSHRYEIEYMENPSNHYPSLLILDDIADTGKTLKEWKDRINVPYYATLHYKKSSIIEPDYYGKKLIKEDKWIVYPWERKDSKSIQDYLKNE
jgi:hypoxanthine phosphoribosyltransferase